MFSRFSLCSVIPHRISCVIKHLSTSSVFAAGRKMNPDKFKLPARYKGVTTSVWNEYAKMYAEYKPVNLGQGFTDYPVPKYITDVLTEVSSSDNFLLHQYTRGFGHVRLVNALSKLYGKLTGVDYNPLTEFLVTVGAYEALFAAINGHIGDGDEVIIIEPFFDSYEPVVNTCGGICRFIPLKPSKSSTVNSSADWVLDYGELEKLFNSKTKMIIVNTPNNPLGKVFTQQELEKIAELCRKWDVICVSDEVYEWLVYDNNKHIRICTLPGMKERTITIGSAGKTFSVTGWKTGWAYGPANLMHNLHMAHQNTVYACPTPIQEAIAIALEREMERLDSDECYFKSIVGELKEKRDFMMKFLQKAGMNVTIPDGGYFMMADWSKLEHKVDLSSESDEYKDIRFTKWMTKTKGVQGIPPSVFYCKEHKHIGEQYVRYCFFKNDESLQKASEIFAKW